MALYTIADLHLSAGVQKPMDIFGGKWQGIHGKDSEELAGSHSAGGYGRDRRRYFLGNQSPAELPDFRILSDLPGKKIIGKGNHDLWWCTVKKMKRFFEENQIKNIDFLFNNCFIYDNIGICGTRGWFYEEDFKESHDEKIFRRELLPAGTLVSGRAGAGRGIDLLLPALSAYLHELSLRGDH